MVDICPTITVETAEQYAHQLSVAADLSHRIHIDLADGSLAPRKLLAVESMGWPDDLKVDLHIMTKHPVRDIPAAVNLRPNLLIVHAEASGNFDNIAGYLHRRSIKVGVALLQDTAPETILPAIDLIDHILIFSGNFGYQGGSVADLGLLEKVKVIRQAKPEIEIGWDGGINDGVVKALVQGGVDVLNVGGYIQSAEDPYAAYAKLINELGQFDAPETLDQTA